VSHEINLFAEKKTDRLQYFANTFDPAHQQRKSIKLRTTIRIVVLCIANGPSNDLSLCAYQTVFLKLHGSFTV
jgi:hypothetical protein